LAQRQPKTILKNKNANPKEAGNLISRVTTFIDSNVQFSTTTKGKITRHTKRQEIRPLQGKINQSTDISERDLKAALLNKHFKQLS
jgi:hypothetical protein